MYLPKNLVVALAVFAVEGKKKARPYQCTEWETSCGENEKLGVEGKDGDIFDCGRDENGDLKWKYRISCPGGGECCGNGQHGVECQCPDGAPAKNYCHSRCGNQGGAPGPDGFIYTCRLDESGTQQWELDRDCEGSNCCTQPGDNYPECRCPPPSVF